MKYLLINNDPKSEKEFNDKNAMFTYAEELAKIHEVIYVDSIASQTKINNVQVMPLKWYQDQKNYLCDLVFISTLSPTSYFENLNSKFTSILSVCWVSDPSRDRNIEIIQKNKYKIDLFLFETQTSNIHFLNIPLGKSFIKSENINDCFDWLHKSMARKIEDVRMLQSIESIENILTKQLPLFYDKPLHGAIFYLKYGNECMKLNNYKIAEMCFNESYAIFPSPSSCGNLTFLYDKTKQYDKFVEWCKKGLSNGIDIAIVNRILDNIQEIEFMQGFELLCSFENYLKHSYTFDTLSTYASICIFLSLKYRLTLEHDKSMIILRNCFKKLIDCTEKMTRKHNIMCSISSNLIFVSNFSMKADEYFEDCLNYERFIQSQYELTDQTFNNNSKIRIGFISGDFANHPVTYILNGFIADLNTNEFEVYLLNNKNSDITHLAFKYTLKYGKNIEISKLTVEESIEKIRSLNLDIIVDMCGHTSSNSTKIISILRTHPAKIICNYFAYPNTTGIKSIDYKLGDEITLNDESKGIYTEKFQIIKDGMHCYKPIDDIVLPKKKNEYIIFGIFNNPQKFTIEFLQTIANILLKSKDSKLHFYYKNFKEPYLRKFYANIMNSFDVTSDRIKFFNYSHASELKEAYANVDICLDTFPYNGGTISIESLHFNTPYISLLGSDYVSRVGASILKQAGHDELIANSIEEYIMKAVNLANDRDILRKYHDELSNNLKKTTLKNGKKFAINFESAIKEMLVSNGYALPANNEKKSQKILIGDNANVLGNKNHEMMRLDEGNAKKLLRLWRIDCSSVPLLKQCHFITHYKILESYMFYDNIIVEVSESASELEIDTDFNESEIIDVKSIKGLHYKIKSNNIKQFLESLSYGDFEKVLENYISS